MEAIAIIGYGGRFPGARDVAELWENLRLGRESIRFFTDEELLRAGIDPALLRNPQYVRARGELDQVDRFDAGFFGFNPREAEVADPQQRIFLESCWEALEHAGYDPETFDGEIGLYAGAALSTYLLYLCSDPALVDLLGWFQVVIGNDKDALATRASYKLNLRGPSVGVQTACSTSLVAVHLACQALLAGECDMALAGGVAVRVPQNTGYLYQEGSILSPDGRCRAFDAQAGGTVGGNGCGVVVLKRLEGALADGDAIHAVIRGSAVNNDGSRKVGYTAPSVEGQASVILEAQRIAGIDPESVGYVEAHGTGTAIGDPIEVSALTQAFQAAGSRRRGYCALGSVKTNVGHLDAAAGVTGLIKAVLAVERGEIPPSLHYRQPNDKIDFAASPFFVGTELREWRPDGAPRRAGVSSFGIGGTNAHVVLEQAPDRPASGPGRGWELLTLSGRSEEVVEQAASRLAAHLAGGEPAPLADVSYTLSVGRRAFGARLAVLCRDRPEALAGLAGKGLRSWSGLAGQGRVAFVFPGQGAQYAGMGRELAEKEPVFRDALAECALAGMQDADLDQTRWTQPALFAVEYALARLWESWGVKPVGMLGHSMGEYVAAVLGGLFDLKDTLWLVSERGRLMQEAEPGAMAAVGLSAEEAATSGLEVAVDNGAAGCVVGGPESEIADLVSRLEASGVWCRRLKTSHAFHTRSMEAAAERFRESVERVKRSRPHRLWISNVTGRLVDPAEARTADYWSRQLRGRVRFGEGLRELLAPGVDLVLEVGPGRGLSALVKRAGPGVEAVPGLVGDGEQEAVLSALGRLWVRGVEVDWKGYWSGQHRHRVPLPTYPFERQRYWIDLPSRRVATVPVLPDTPVDSGVALDSEHSRPELESAYVAPRNSMEEALAGIWQQLLGLDRVGVHDDFFELGGDSILSIQVAARAARQGIRITSAEVFEHPSVAALAAVARRSAPTVPEDRPVEGPVRLTPSQLRFFETAADDPRTYSQAVMLESRDPVDAGHLREALARLVHHHDALRLRFERTEDGWSQHNAPAETSELMVEADDVRGGLDLQHGPLIRAALLRSEGRPDRVLLVAHALVVDGVSWRILLEDLESAYEGRALPARTTSYQEWAERLGQAAEAGRWDAEGEAWLEASRGEAAGETGAAREATAVLDEEETRQLLQEAPEAYRTRVEDLLLTALAATLAEATGRGEVRVELEGHGRQPEQLGDGLDLSRTVGRFIAAYPVKLRLRPGMGPGPAIQSVKEQLRSVPGQGLGYGALRYGPGEWGSRLREQPGCEVGFNYLGQLEAGFSEGDERFRWTGEGAGGGSPHRSRYSRHALEVRVWVARGRLEVRWTAGPERLGLAERYLDTLRGLLRHCLEPGAGGYTPSDFPLAGLDQATLDRLAGGGRRIEDIYPLSPMQEGMLFQSLYRPGYSIYLEQLGAVLEGHLDVLAFRRAWSHVVRKHPVLRAAFLWEGIERPVQVVHRFVDLPWQQLDFSHLDPEQARRELDRVLAEDRRLGFSLKEAPLLRVTLAKMGPQTWSIDWSFHHILIDGWSIGLVLKDVLETYERLAQGRPLDPARPQLYTSYIAWLGQQDLDKAEAWWRAELAGFRSPTPLRLSPGSALSGSGGIDDYLDEVLQLPAASTAALQAWARSRQLTLNTLVQGAWALLLARHAGKDDVVFGSTVSGRPSELPDIETMVGLFINSLPFRVRVDGGRPAPEWLKELQSRHAALREYQFSPLVRVQHWSEVPRGVPLFNSILIFENYPVQPYLREQREGFRIDAVHTNPVKGFYDFILIAAPGERLKLTLTYDRRLASPEDARRRLRDLEETLMGLAADPPRLVGELLAVDGEPEAAGLQGEAVGPTAGSTELVHRRILAQAARTPDALAVLDGEVSISYGELGRRARCLARFLQRLGVGPEVRVGVCLDAGIEAVVALLGVLEAGGAYVPLAPDHPAERLRWMIEDSGAGIVLTLQDHAGHLGDPIAGPDVRVVRLDVERERIEAEADEPREAVDPDNLAYAIYTSGSTGRPKGVLVSHGGLASYTSAMIRHLGLTATDRFLHGIALSFDAAGEEIYPVLCAGGAVVVDRRLGDSPPGELLERCGRVRATVLHIVTPWWRQVASALEEGSVRLPASARLVVSGGEILTGRDARPLSVPFVNAYGPTEATITSTLYRTRPDDAGRLPIGRPIQNAEVYVLDAGGERTPVDAAGEIHIGGAGVARGYLRRPDLTAERFVPHPFAMEPGARLYRTGDLGRWRADGELEFLGRADDQVKLRGYRIELGEIETALQEMAGVREVAAQLRDGRLVAWVAGDAPAGELRRRLGERLPDYMVPAVFVRVPALPRNAFGKLDRLALPEPGPERPELEQDYAAPGSPVEQALAAIWRQLLKLDRVGVHDNFFELGGDSILSIQVVSRAAREGIRLTPAEVFANPTIAALATVARREARAAANRERVEGPVWLTPIQRWFFEADPEDPHHFNQAVMLEALEPVDAGRFRGALARIVEHHDALRLRFELSAGTAEIAPEERADLLVEVDGDMDRVRGLQAGLDLRRGPLLRAALVRFGDGRPDRLALLVHHLAVDGVSWRLLLEDLDAAYAGRELPGKATSYQEWSERLWQAAEAGRWDGEGEAWLEASRGPDALPVDGEGGELRVGTAREVTAGLDPEATRQLLQEAPEAYRTQINDLLLTALAATLAEWTGRDEARIEMEGHGRQPEQVDSDLDLSRTVGWFTTVYPVKLRIEPGWGPGTAIKSVKEQLRRVPGQGLGYGVLRYGSGPWAELLRAEPGCAVSFNYLGQLEAGLDQGEGFRWAGEGVGNAHSPRQRRRHLLEINAWVARGRLEVSWVYSPERHAEATVSRLAGRYLAKLREIVDHCLSPGTGGCTPSDFPLAGLDQATLDRLAGGSREIEDVYPLSPMQEGMLFHSLHAPRSSTYFEQFAYWLHADLDERAFRRAWQSLIDRHAVLRTSFAWDTPGRPIQIVHRRAELVYRSEDWRGEADVPSRLARFLREDRERGFDLSRPPLLRVSVLRTDDRTHRFVWSIHHLLGEGWSNSLLLRDVLETYRALLQGGEPDLEPVRPYRDYIAWLQRQSLVEAEVFWRRTLAGFEEPTALAIDRAPGRPAGDADPGTESLRLDAGETASLLAWARSRQLTLNTLVQGAWALLLSVYSGREDVVFGCTVAGRPAALPGVESMVGLFINTLPLRVRVDAGEPVASWLGRLQAEQAELRQHEHSPLVQVQAWSEVPRGTPLFETLLVFENVPVDATLQQYASALETRSESVFERTNYPLELLAVPGAELSLTLRHDAERFETGAVRRMLGHLRNALLGLATDGPLGRVQILDETERLQVVTGWNRTERDYEGLPWIPDGIAAQAARTPEAVAVVFEETALSYGELNRRANQVARRLRELGVGPEVPVGVCLERSADLVIALLGVLKSGGAYVPLEPEYPAERLRWMVEDAGLRVVLCQGEGHEALRGTQLVAIDGAAVRGEAQEDVAPGVQGDTPAYVLYTSGSTGVPKGAANTHRGLRNRLAWMQEAFRLGPADRVLQKTPFSFDVSVWEFFWPLLHGAALVVARPGGHRDPKYLAEAVAAQRVTVVHFVPSMLELFAEEPGLEACRSLRLVVSSGEGLSGSLAERFLSRGVGSLENLYGPTEAAVDVTWWHCDPGDGSVPIGRPIANTQMYVLDRAGEPLPVGVTGELCIGGVQLARGYWNRPVLTAERFVPDPFGAVPGSRLYRTGDLGRWREDGALEYLGRTDGQVKLRGFRIELGEVESALLALEGVREAAAQVRDGRLVAYLSGNPAPGEVRRQLEAKLPEQLVPAVFVKLEALPRTTSGKLDRRALPDPGRERPNLEERLAAPGNAVEDALAAIWMDLLQLDEVGVHDDFFALGGDSILSLQVVSRAAQKGIHLTTAEVFAHPTIARLAAIARQETRAASRERVEGPVRLTPVQHWFFEADLVDPHQFNQAVVLEARDPLDPGRLRQALARLVEHHDALRLRFEREGGVWLQHNAAEEPADLLVELQGDAAQVDAAAHDLQRSLDLGRGPLLRAALIRLDGRPDRLFLLAHHLVVDGVSWRILLEDLASAYAGRELPGKTTSYQEWSERLWETAEAGCWEDEGPWWLEASRPEGPELPLDSDAGETLVGTARAVRVGLDEEETRRLLQDASGAYQTQTDDLLLAALASTLVEWAGGAVRVELEGHGRQPERVGEGLDLSRTVGWFTTVHPVKLRLEAWDPGAAVRSVKEQLRSVPGRGLGYGVLRYGGGTWGDLLRAQPPCALAFNYLGQLEAGMESGEAFRWTREAFGGGRSPRQRRRHLLEINAWVAQGCLELSWTYSPERHAEATVRALAEGCLARLREILAHCLSPEAGGYTPSDFPEAGLSQADLDALAAEFEQSLEMDLEMDG